MRLADQFDEILNGGLPDRWEEAEITVTLQDPAWHERAAERLAACGAYTSRPGAFTITATPAQARTALAPALKHLDSNGGGPRGVVTVRDVRAPLLELHRWLGRDPSRGSFGYDLPKGGPAEAGVMTPVALEHADEVRWAKRR